MNPPHGGPKDLPHPGEHMRKCQKCLKTIPGHGGQICKNCGLVICTNCSPSSNACPNCKKPQLTPLAFVD